MYAFCVQLGELLASRGVIIHESTRVIDVPSTGPPHVVVTEGGGTVTAHTVVMATHLPITDRSRHFAVVEPARSYCLAVTLTDPSRVPRQGYISAETPTRSLRPAGSNNDVLVVAGSGHKMGAAVDTRAPYDDLEAWTRAHFPVAEVLARWSSFDYLSADCE
jgi:glycine/D-amino acid oxidase-like deaminating enzyme